jgi:glycosyltransferase involved in cell wall biosynthesis
MSDLFHAVAPDLDAHLFKGGGARIPGETVVSHISRNGMLARALGPRLPYRRYQLEFASFAAMLLPHLWRGGFDLVHVIDPPLLSHLSRLKRLCSLPYHLVFTHAGPAAVANLGRADHVHCLTPASAAEARAADVAPDRLSELPVGISSKRFARPADRDTLRARWNVPRNRFTILCIASINRHHKRIDYLIDEVARLNDDFLLWVDGSLHPDGDPELLKMAAARLGPRFRHTHVEADQVAELFGLADVLVSASLHESFGMAVVEAMSAGLPVLVHDSEHFRWLADDGAHRLDMTRDGAVAECLGEMKQGVRPLKPPRDPRSAVARFDWDVLRHEYVAMYQRAAAARGVS